MEEVIRIQGLRKSFGANEILKGVDFSVRRGEVVCLIGASGSGKSTMLRCINLLETPSGGEICFRGQNVLELGKERRAYCAKLGMVFQSFNLFDNLTVLQNCVMPQLRVLRKGKSQAEQTAREYLAKVGMEQYANAKPRQLSGGQKQRVAIARALSMEPEAMLPRYNERAGGCPPGPARGGGPKSERKCRFNDRSLDPPGGSGRSGAAGSVSALARPPLPRKDRPFLRPQLCAPRSAFTGQVGAGKQPCRVPAGGGGGLRH